MRWLTCVYLAWTIELGAAQRASVQTGEREYLYSYEVLVTFENISSRSRDWVGIYPADAASFRQMEPLLWLYTCGTQLCSSTASSGSLRFGYSDPISDTDESFFPLLPDTYVAVLQRNQFPPYQKLAQSYPFSVRTVGSQPAKAFVATNLNSYQIGETMEIDFYDPLSEQEDWVAIYDSDVNLSNLSGSLIWLRTCGSQTCQDLRTSGKLRFGYGPPDESWRGNSFPLMPGRYIAVLGRSMGGGQSIALASSAIFSVV